MSYTLIIEKKKTENSGKMIKLLKEKVKLELFENTSINGILDEYVSQPIERVIFHASGRDGVTPDNAGEYLEKILEWKDEKTLLFAVSEGDTHREKMKKKIMTKGAKNSYVDSYNSYMNAFKKKIREVESEEK